jgi:hypothetical protein
LCYNDSLLLNLLVLDFLIPEPPWKTRWSPSP